ncbi:MAG: hopanoid biosynthesis-associated protein HpnK [Verrucomicrobia bacterium]|nr:hopanoid biosynthesis-associated protein HpnK [Verrucomicrobiota bacterium]
MNADDFGASSSINQAVVEAHVSGILTTASLMVTRPAAQEAVELARRHPTLGVGLHLTLADGYAASPQAASSGLAEPSGKLPASPTVAGLRYFFNRRLREPLRAEIRAQLERFHATGLRLDHVNGHLNIHLHPTVFSILLEERARWSDAGFRLVRDPLRLNLRIAKGRWVYRGAHALIYGLLSRAATGRLRSRGVRHTEAVFGLLQYPRVDEDYFLRLAPFLPPGVSEIYSHPSLDQFRHEFEALRSPRVRRLLDELGIERLRYADLAR